MKKPGAAVEMLQLEKAITEHEGTEKEKKCMCQAVCFRIAQLASQAWKDGVFRTYEVKQIRTGWNSGGPWEFFSDKEMHGEIGDLKIPAAKILIRQPDGSEATHRFDLVLSDAWFEITLTDGRVLSFKAEKDGLFPPGFLKARTGFKKEEKGAEKPFKKLYKQAISGILAVPFSGFSMHEGPVK
jgi:hypothetical protein